MNVQPRRRVSGTGSGVEATTDVRQATVDAWALPAGAWPWPLVLRVRPALELSEDQFFDLCQINGDLRFERTADGVLEIMPPAGSATGYRNADITAQLWTWAKREGTGLAFDSSAGFTLPNGATRSPDASWIARSRWEDVPPERRDRFAPVCPDFVLELRSPTDRLATLQEKLAEYLANGARLGWLLDPLHRHVYVYRPGAPVERLESLESVSGDPVLPGFTLDLREIW
ncbi:MAG: Uma2 family endonuclease [Chloroflexota bacterium]|nr:Uma2 family endonuclease [Chloroflexota bacterium]